MAELNHDQAQQRVQAYHTIVQQYEQLDQEIDALIMRNNGASKNMSDADRAQYRDLVRQRWDLQNEMRIMERELFEDENDNLE